MAMQVMVRDVRAMYRRTEAVAVSEARDPQGTGDAAAQRRTCADLEGDGPGGDEIAAVMWALSDVSATSSGTATAWARHR